MHVFESNIARIISTLPVLLVALAACANATYGDAYPVNGDSVDNGPSTSEGGGAALGGGDDSAVAGSFSVAGSVGTVGDTGGQDTPSAAGSSSLGLAGAAGSASAAGGSAGSSSTAGVCSAPAWVPNMVYRMGDKATKSGKEYTAAYYTMADPEQHCCGDGQDWASSIPCP